MIDFGYNFKTKYDNFYNNSEYTNLSPLCDYSDKYSKTLQHSLVTYMSVLESYNSTEKSIYRDQLQNSRLLLTTFSNSYKLSLVNQSHSMYVFTEFNLTNCIEIRTSGNYTFPTEREIAMILNPNNFKHNKIVAHDRMRMFKNRNYIMFIEDGGINIELPYNCLSYTRDGWIFRYRLKIDHNKIFTQKLNKYESGLEINILECGNE